MTTERRTIDPEIFPSAPDLLFDLLDGIDFESFPIDMLNHALSAAAAVIEVIEHAPDGTAHHVASAALDQVRIAQDIIERWHAQTARPQAEDHAQRLEASGGDA